MNPNKEIPTVIELSDCRVDKYQVKDLERLKPFNGIIARENSGLYLQLRLVRNRLLLELRSEVQNPRASGTKRATKRRSFWKSETCPDMTPALLGSIKNEAEAFRKEIKTAQGVLSDFTESWIATFSNEYTRKNYRKALNRPYIADWLKDRLVCLSINDLNAVDRMIVADDIQNRTKNEYRGVLFNFLKHVASETGNKTLMKAVFEFNFLKTLKEEKEKDHNQLTETKTESNLESNMTDEMSDFEKSLQSNPNVEKRSIPVYLIKDLDLLKKNPYNRDINKSSVKKYVEEGVLPDTIFLINEKGEILDGQHRIEACKELNQPVWVQIVPNGDEFFIKKINTLGVVWTTEDHIKFYAQQGNQHYQKLLLIINKYKGQKAIPLQAILSTLAGSAIWGGIIQTTVRTGKWEVRVSDKYVLPVFDYLVELGKINVHFNNILKQMNTRFTSLVCLFMVEYICLGNNLNNFKKSFEKALPLLGQKISEHKMDIFETLSDVVSYNRKTNRFDYKTERPMFLKYLNAGQYL